MIEVVDADRFHCTRVTRGATIQDRTTYFRHGGGHYQLGDMLLPPAPTTEYLAPKSNSFWK